MNKILAALNASAYSLTLLLTSLLTFVAGAFLDEKHSAFGTGMGLIAAVISYRLLEHRQSTDGTAAEPKRLLLALAALTVNILITGPDTLLPALLFVTFGALFLSSTLTPTTPTGDTQP